MMGNERVESDAIDFPIPGTNPPQFLAVPLRPILQVVAEMMAQPKFRSQMNELLAPYHLRISRNNKNLAG